MITLQKSRKDQNDDSFAKKRGRSMMMIALQKSRKDQDDDNCKNRGRTRQCQQVSGKSPADWTSLHLLLWGDNISNILNILDVSNISNIKVS